MKRMFVYALPLLLAVASVHPASATTITPGTDGIDAVAGGVFELGLDNLLLVRFDSTGSGDGKVSTLEASYMGGITPRYFVLDNLSLAANLSLFYGKMSTETPTGEESASDLGFLGVAMLNYYLRLGYGMFFAPGVGAGGFYGSRSIPNPDPTAPGTSLDYALYGGAVRLDLGFVFYAGPHFNLKGGPELLARFGKVKADVEGAAAEDLLTIEAAFHIGLAYSF